MDENSLDEKMLLDKNCLPPLYLLIYERNISLEMISLANLGASSVLALISCDWKMNRSAVVVAGETKTTLFLTLSSLPALDNGIRSFT